jgi:hypothetical protein
VFDKFLLFLNRTPGWLSIYLTVCSNKKSASIPDDNPVSECAQRYGKPSLVLSLDFSRNQRSQGCKNPIRVFDWG